MTDLELDAVQKRYSKATKALGDICLGKWTMSVPANLEHDQDLIISKSLYDIPVLIAALKEHPK